MMYLDFPAGRLWHSGMASALPVARPSSLGTGTAPPPAPIGVTAVTVAPTAAPIFTHADRSWWRGLASAPCWSRLVALGIGLSEACAARAAWHVHQLRSASSDMDSKRMDGPDAVAIVTTLACTVNAALGAGDLLGLRPDDTIAAGTGIVGRLFGGLILRLGGADADGNLHAMPLIAEGGMSFLLAFLAWGYLSEQSEPEQESTDRHQALLISLFITAALRVFGGLSQPLDSSINGDDGISRTEIVEVPLDDAPAGQA